MTLGLSAASSGDFMPIAIYDARAGRFFKVERHQGAAGWESQRVDITSPVPSFAVDLRSIEVGYVYFSPSGPDFKLVPLGTPLPAQPSKDYKQCFRVKIAGKVLDGVREFSHSAKCVLAAMDDLHTRYEGATEASQGKIPIVQISGTTPIATKGPQGTTTNYAPVFSIIGWADRLAEMGEATVALPGHKAPVATPAPVAHVPPPTHPTAHVPPPGHMPPPGAVQAQQAAPSEMPF